MERYDIRVNVWGDVSGPQYEWETVKAEDGDFVLYTDAQATVEALQAIIKQMGEQAARLAKDGMAARAQVEALQRERDHWESYFHTLLESAKRTQTALDAERQRARTATQLVVEMIGATGPEDLESALGRLVAQLNAEREKVAERNEFIADCDMALDLIQAPRTNDGQEELVSTWRRIELLGGLLQQYRVQLEEHVRTQAHLSQLKALVRALPVAIAIHVDCSIERYVRYCTSEKLNYECAFPSKEYAQAFVKLLEYRATLDATTPAAKGGDGE